jgi:hypothetical protein
MVAPMDNSIRVMVERGWHMLAHGWEMEDRDLARNGGAHARIP